MVKLGEVCEISSWVELGCVEGGSCWLGFEVVVTVFFVSGVYERPAVLLMGVWRLLEVCFG